MKPIYQYVESKDTRSDLVKICTEIINDLQRKVKDYFTFDFRLIGSGDRRLITQKIDDGQFDLDYNLIIQKDKQMLISDPKRIKELFLSALNRINPEYGFKFPQNSRSVITSLLGNSFYKFSFDMAILVEGNNGNYLKLIYDKDSNRYIWNEMPKTLAYDQKFKKLKELGYWKEIKDRYIAKKNSFYTIKYEKTSFMVFIETINELYSTYCQ